ncbi:riboflavin synthase [Neoconidiobolus thromboides FSU 785]|nr:riboflavin synthase [Neoconidiobolus thromboides FSU 785]
MFTGLVEHIGTILDIKVLDTTEEGGNSHSLTIGNAGEILQDCKLGDSIAVNGTCLTVTEFNEDTFKVTLAPETLRRTNLIELSVDSKVNLERASLGVTRFGGHFVQGHVDDTIEIIEVTQEKSSIWYKFKVDKEHMKYIVAKGYVCLDGTSLTVCDVFEDAFTIMMIPFTQAHVIMPTKKIGDKVNLEVDMLGKYVHKIVANNLTNDLENEDSVIYKMVQKIVKNQLEKKEGL